MHRTQWRKKKKKRWSKVAAKVWQWIPPCSVLQICHWVMETENWELSNGNRVMVMPNRLLAIGPTIFELWVMEIEIWVMKIDEPNTPLVTWWNWCQARRTSLEWIWGPLKSFTQPFKIEIQPHSSGKIGFLVVWPNVWEREEIEMEINKNSE